MRMHGDGAGDACGVGVDADARVGAEADPLSAPVSARRRAARRLGLNFVLVATMVLGPFPLMAPAVVAADLIGDLGISTGTFGVAITTNTVVAALFAPMSGRLTDSIGPKLSTVATIATSGAGLIGMALAPDMVTLILSASFAGLGQGWCNPATNKLIAERVPPGRRGTITGLKQSGVMLGSFLAGATLPTLAVWFGWRTAVAAYGVASLACAAGIGAWLRPDAPTARPAQGRARAGAQAQLRPSESAARPARGVARAGAPVWGYLVRWRSSAPHPPARSAAAAAMTAAAESTSAGAAAGERATGLARPERRYIAVMAWYSLLMGAVVGGVGRFQPLFAEEALGWTNFWAGMSSALVGVAAVGSRIWWARLTEARVRPASALAVQAALTVAAMLLLLGASGAVGGLLWPMSVLAGFSMASWNAVAMLAIITGVPVAQAGRASGIVMAGFMSGLSIGGLATGYIAQWSGSFDLAWIIFAGCAAGATALALAMGRHK